MLKSAVPVLEVAQMDEAIAYYNTAMGFPTEWISDGGNRVQLRRDDAQLQLLRVDSVPDKWRHGVFFPVERLEKLFVEFAASGAFHRSFPRDLGTVVEHEPLTDHDGNRDLVFLDPFGYLHRAREIPS